MDQLIEAAENAVELLRNQEINGEEGLPESVFLLTSSLVPLPSVDLLIVNSKNQILLSRRNDLFFEKSWHIPGGCLRYGEDFSTRIQQTARREIGCEVSFEERPVAVRNVIRGVNPNQPHPRERGHNVAILFCCTLPDGFEIDNYNLTEEDNGYLKWFDRLPPDFLKIQNVYSDVLTPWRV